MILVVTVVNLKVDARPERWPCEVFAHLHSRSRFERNVGPVAKMPELGLEWPGPNRPGAGPFRANFSIFVRVHTHRQCIIRHK